MKPDAQKVLDEMEAYCVKTSTTMKRLINAAGVSGGFPARLRAGGGRPETFAKIRAFMAVTPNGVPPEPLVGKQESDVMAQVGSEALLRALLRYGKRNDSDLGMGYQAFMAAVAQHGV